MWGLSMGKIAAWIDKDYPFDHCNSDPYQGTIPLLNLGCVYHPDKDQSFSDQKVSILVY